MKNIFVYAFFLFVSLQSISANLSTFYNDIDAFMKANVVNGSVKYQSIKSNASSLNKLVADIGDMNLSTASALEKKAFYINAYNVLVISGIIKKYPVAQPLDIDGFFDKQKFKIAGEQLALNDIENKKLREVYKDARLHFVLVCAARGCPKIVNYAYIPDKLDSQIQERAVASINDAKFTKVVPKNKAVYISEIFFWYKADFVSGNESFVNYLNMFRKEGAKIPTQYTVEKYPYDWKLNDYK